ncbi:rhodanese-like domain-containing protein [Aquitalea pelogenes]|uniref:rhodanese-like domain-containing protein n=1 Tax=Aquitalea pelogenes TaxID=1293573 RepID=UPI0007899300|nr:rhodanese-like domain-containing protein [Aquitalea pelogenes]
MFNFISRLLFGAGKPVALPANVLVVDVREPAEFAGAHVTGAINIPLADIPAHSAQLLAEARPVVLYCQAGMRAGHARKMLLAAGLPQVINGKNMATVNRLLQQR